MTKRIEEIIKLVEPGKGVIDVGTDHGYVPVALAERGYAGGIIASDLNEAPLAAAESRAAEHGVWDKIRFFRADGLDCCGPADVNNIICAGMGGDLICSILDKPRWLHQKGMKLILQPMTKAEVLRYWLVNNGFGISRETVVRENGRLFHIIRADYCGVFYKLPESASCCLRLSYAELYTGPKVLLFKSQYASSVIDSCKTLVSKRLLGASGAENTLFTDIFNNLEEMKREHDELQRDI